MSQNLSETLCHSGSMTNIEWDMQHIVAGSSMSPAIALITCEEVGLVIVSPDTVQYLLSCHLCCANQHH